MTTYQFELQVVLEAETLDEAWDELADLLTQRRFLHSNAVVTDLTEAYHGPEQVRPPYFTDGDDTWVQGDEYYEEDMLRGDDR